MNKLYSKITPFYILIAVGLITFQACIKEKIDVTKSGNNSINPQYAGALVYSSLTLKNIMAKASTKGQITTDSTGFLTLVYKGQLVSIPTSSIVTIPTQPATNVSFTLTPAEVTAINATPTTSTISVSDSSFINFQAGGNTQVNTLSCKTATLSLNLSYGLEQDAVIKVTIPSATLNGVPFSQTIPINVPVPYNLGGPMNVTENYSLNGYNIDMTNGGTTHNLIKVLYNVILTKTNNTTAITDSINFSETFNNVTFNNITGYLGQQSLFAQTDTVPVSIFQNSATVFGSGASFQIVNPIIKIFLSNSFGMPISANFNTFEGYSPGFGNTAITGAPNPLPIPFPTTLGQTAKDSFQLSNANSNVTSLINNFPKNVIFNLNSMSNPLGPVYSNFLTDSSEFNVNLELDLPLYGTVKNFMFQDTVSYSFDTSLVSKIESITVRAYLTNGFPIDVGMSLAFVDANYNVICQLINPPNQVILPSASIDSTTGIVTSATQHTQDFTVPNSVIPQLGKVKHILIGAEATSANNGTTPVKFYNFYSLDVKLGVNVQTYIKF